MSSTELLPCPSTEFPGRTSPAAPHQQPSWPAPAPHCLLFPFEGPLPGPRLLCTVAWSHASCNDTWGQEALLFWQAPQAGLPLHLVPGRRLPCFSLKHPALTPVLPSCYKEHPQEALRPGPYSPPPLSQGPGGALESPRGGSHTHLGGVHTHTRYQEGTC